MPHKENEVITTKTPNRTNNTEKKIEQNDSNEETVFNTKYWL